ncbi:MAG: N-acetyltransferase [Elusimicrobia bacterium]|nr:N-acetyltransferase [Elusimicrobiota bacterium]
MSKSKISVKNGNVSLGKGCKIHRTAILGMASPRKKSAGRLGIGRGAIVRSGAVIYGNTTIGDGLETGHNAVIREENKIGDNFNIWNNSVIDYGCTIGNNVKVHSNVYVAQYTALEDGVFLAPGVTIANDPHPGCSFSKKCMRGPTIKKGARIGVNSTILPFVVIGKNCLVGAGSVVTKNIPAGSVAYGNPARVCGKVSELVCDKGITDRPYPDRGNK